MVQSARKNDKQTTAQRLGNVIKSCRDIMRKDKGLSGDADRLPMLTWIMFLKFLDDVERIRETEARIAGRDFKLTIEPPYRWRDWAANPAGITGEELLAFVNQDEAIRPDGKRGPGLFAYLRLLRGSRGRDRRDVLAAIFKGTTNRMISGYLLRDVLNKVDEIQFASSDQIHVLSHIYESLLREMRDAAGDSGEFYTPRPVVKFIVNVISPQLGEVVLDPAAGTGGFLVESLEYLKSQCKTTDDFARLQEETLYGIEAKPLPYLLCQMNLLLHGLENPNIDPGNALRFPLREIGDKDRVDIIMTNPPFGGEEEPGILGNFPEDKQTRETALLFLQLIMRKLRRQPKLGRAGVVVPNGTLFGDKVCALIKKELLEEFNLHTIVRLPKGVFAPYTDQETNILFFDRTGPTMSIWFYEHPLPRDRQALKNPCYVKSKPLLYEEFQSLLAWWRNRHANEFAWEVGIDDIRAGEYNLDIRHPKHSGQKSIRSRKEVLASIDEGLGSFVSNIKSLLRLTRDTYENLPSQDPHTLKGIVELGVKVNPESIKPESTPTKEFLYIDLSSVSLNVIDNVKTIIGADAPSRARRLIRENDVILSTVRPYLCGHAVVPPEFNGQVCSTGFAVLRCPPGLHPKFLYYMLVSPRAILQYVDLMQGSHYPALKGSKVKRLLIPDLPVDEQSNIVEKLDALYERMAPLKAAIEAFGQRLGTDLDALFPAILSDIYGEH